MANSNPSATANAAEMIRRQPDGPIFAPKHGPEINARIKRYLGRRTFARHRWQTQHEAILQEIKFMARHRSEFIRLNEYKLNKNYYYFFFLLYFPYIYVYIYTITICSNYL